MMTTKLHNDYGTLKVTNLAEDMIYDAMLDHRHIRWTEAQYDAAQVYWDDVAYWQPDDVDMGYCEPLTLQLVEVRPDAAGNTQYDYRWV